MSVNRWGRLGSVTSFWWIHGGFRLSWRWIRPKEQLGRWEWEGAQIIVPVGRKFDLRGLMLGLKVFLPGRFFSGEMGCWSDVGDEGSFADDWCCDCSYNWACPSSFLDRFLSLSALQFFRLLMIVLFLLLFDWRWFSWCWWFGCYCCCCFCSCCCCFCCCSCCCYLVFGGGSSLYRYLGPPILFVGMVLRLQFWLAWCGCRCCCCCYCCCCCGFGGLLGAGSWKRPICLQVQRRGILPLKTTFIFWSLEAMIWGKARTPRYLGTYLICRHRVPSQMPGLLPRRHNR